VVYWPGLSSTSFTTSRLFRRPQQKFGKTQLDCHNIHTHTRTARPSARLATSWVVLDSTPAIIYTPALRRHSAAQRPYQAIFPVSFFLAASQSMTNISQPARSLVFQCTQFTTILLTSPTRLRSIPCAGSNLLPHHPSRFDWRARLSIRLVWARDNAVGGTWRTCS
jgi:hypothetical protein